MPILHLMLAFVCIYFIFLLSSTMQEDFKTLGIRVHDVVMLTLLVAGMILACLSLCLGTSSLLIRGEVGVAILLCLVASPLSYGGSFFARFLRKPILPKSKDTRRFD